MEEEVNEERKVMRKGGKIERGGEEERRGE